MKRVNLTFVSSHDSYVADSDRPACSSVAELVMGVGNSELAENVALTGFQLGRNTLRGLIGIGYWDASVQQQWGLPWHRNEGLEICYLDQGGLDICIDKEDNWYELESGDITITNSWQKHRIGNPYITPSRLVWFIFDVNARRPNQKWQWPDWIILSKTDIEELTHCLRYCDHPVMQSTKELKICFSSILNIVSLQDPTEHISMLAVLINQLFILLLGQFRMHGPKLQTSVHSSQKTVEIFIDDLKTDIKAVSHQWTIDEMANECGLGKSQFCNYFKHLTNMSPGEYLVKCRINWAVRLMTDNPSVSIKGVRLSCGFSSSQYFSNTFKKVKGVCPKVYLSKYRNGEDFDTMKIIV